jgi:hypothetical protein
MLVIVMPPPEMFVMVNTLAPEGMPRNSSPKSREVGEDERSWAAAETAADRLSRMQTTIRVRS